MKNRITFRNFLQILSHPRVFIFILIGTSIIFLTFLTDNNALEIAISGFASVFIGIGVNNFTSMETRMKDERRIQTKISHSLEIMLLARSWISRICDDVEAENISKIKNELAEFDRFINIGIQLLKEDSSLN